MAVIYPRKCSLDMAIKGLQIFLDDLKLRLVAQKGEAATRAAEKYQILKKAKR